MIVAIDVGNSAVKVARVQDDAVALVAQVPTADLARARAVIADGAAAGAEAIVLVSVVPTWSAAVQAAAPDLGLRLIVADQRTIPIKVRVPRPEAVGADRLLDAWAAVERYRAPLIAVDLGTATTVDAVDADGAFMGGAILPGIDLGARALARGTAQLPEIDVADLPAPIGRDTPSAIASGLVLGHLGAVRELVTRMRARLGGGATVIVTGGLSRASWADAWTNGTDGLAPIADVVDPDLTLRGLGLLGATLSVHAA
jgi:type III pantothenate kinase